MVETDERANLQGVQVDGQRVDIRIVAQPKQSKMRKIVNRLSQHKPKQPRSLPPADPAPATKGTVSTVTAKPSTADTQHFYEPIQEHYTSLQGPHERHRPERRRRLVRNKNQKKPTTTGDPHCQQRRGHRHSPHGENKPTKYQTGQRQTETKRLHRTKEDELHSDYPAALSVLSLSSDKSQDSHLEDVTGLDRRPPASRAETSLQRVKDGGYMNPIKPTSTERNNMLNKL